MSKVFFALIYSYNAHYFPFIAPYLLPATNTLMTCSVYATVIVALNRKMELSGSRSTTDFSRMNFIQARANQLAKSGSLQTILVFVFSVLFNLVRWFEHKYEYIYQLKETVDPLEPDTVWIEGTPFRNESTLTITASDSV